MKFFHNLITALFIGILLCFFSCQDLKQKELLHGEWKAVSLNGEPLQKHGFSSIKMKLFQDSIEIVTEINTFGNVTTKSIGVWEYNGQTLRSNIGDNNTESVVTLRNSILILAPDPLLKRETVQTSEYLRVQ